MLNIHRNPDVNKLYLLARKYATVIDEKIKYYYNVLEIPYDSNQQAIKQAFISLAKRYHPDSGSPQASVDKFCQIEQAFRELSKFKTGKIEKIDAIVFDIKHTAPQHRQYLSYEGVGHGTPAQREKYWQQTRAQKAAHNVMKHRVSKAVAAENTLMQKGDYYAKKHDVKTKYGFDRLVEDLIQEAMGKGEFENLSGKGKPLKGQNFNPYVDFTTHKLNEVLINNGFTPEWILLNKDISELTALLKDQLSSERSTLGPHPLDEENNIKWRQICEKQREMAKKINNKIQTFNLIVPLLNKQMIMLDFDRISDDILKNGSFRREKQLSKTSEANKEDVVLGVFNNIYSLIAIILGKEKGS